MDEYDADVEHDPAWWRSLDEADSLGLVADYHRRCRPHPKAGNQRLHDSIHVVVENQIAMGDETPAAAKLAELVADGLSRHDAIHAIGSVVSEVFSQALGRDTRESENLAPAYEDRVKALTASAWLNEWEEESSGDVVPPHMRPRSAEELIDPGLGPGKAQDPDAIVAALDQPSPLFPRTAILAVREQGEAAVDGLIGLIDRAGEVLAAGGNPEGNGHLFASFLLAEMQEQRGFAPVSALFSGSEHECDRLGEDFVTEDLGRVLASFPNAGLAEMTAIVEDRSRSVYGRAAGVTGIAALVASDRIDRNQATGYLHRLFLSAKEEELYLDAAGTLLSLYAEESFDDIRAAIRSGRIAEREMGLEEVARTESLGLDAAMRELRETRYIKLVSDTIAETSWWACFDPAEFDDDDYDEDDDFGGEAIPDFPALETVRRASPKIGRNEPCPCGSGKKFKKCCGT